MRWRALSWLIVFATLSFQVPRAAAFDWDSVTDAEKSMKSNPRGKAVVRQNSDRPWRWAISVSRV